MVLLGVLYLCSMLRLFWGLYFMLAKLDCFKHLEMKKIITIFLVTIGLIACSASSEKGQAVGFVTHFSREGVFWKSWELELNKSQTGMTSTANEMQLSVDNDNEDQTIVNQLDSAQKYGWKVQVDYQQNFGTNCMNNRGQTAKFIKKVEILVDTIYVIIVPKPTNP